MKKINYIIHILMIFLVIALALMPGFVFSEENLIYIKNADDLIQLSKDCSFDQWSRGKTVILDNDIDLKNLEFTPIPIFGGLFDGNDHTISGLNIKVEGSNQGLFRYLEEGAIVRDLSVEGSVLPSGEKSIVGGLAGNNKGTLENCEFKGLVKGKDTIGGLVGWNNSTGQIIDSYFDGIIYGDSKVGGISGYNSGTILACENNSSVNTSVEDPKVDITDITLENIQLTNLVADATDIGGIVGLNIGVVQSSENYGEVGYPHSGYNVGGIAGRQSGYLTKSSNYGDIYGRKEVAGIVGQIEPHISTIIESSMLEGLERELNALDSSITKMIADAKSTSDITTQNFLSLQDKIDTSKGHVKSLIDQTEVLVSDGMEELDKISIIGLEALEILKPVIGNMTNLIGVMESSVDEMENSLDHISAAIDDLSPTSEALSQASHALNDSIEKIKQDKKDLKVNYQNLLKINELLVRGEINEACELIRSVSENLKAIHKSIKTEIINVTCYIQDIKDILKSIDYPDLDLDKALDEIGGTIDKLRYPIDNLSEMVESFSSLLTFLTSQEGPQFVTSNDSYEKTKEDLYGSIGDISQSLSYFVEDSNLQGNTFIDDLQDVNDQLFKMMNMMVSIIEEISSGEIDKEDIVRDVSGEDIDNQTEGKVSDCTNFGDVEGDLNVGGISGGMSIELLDPEKDLNLQGRLSYNTVFERRAIILNCENEGSIRAKKDSVGGIVGSMDLGYLKDCRVISSVKSSDGNYVGGIAGKSDAPIVSSYARATLGGGNYIGGIAGLGKEIIDSYSLVKIEDHRACIGAIAGNINESSNIRTNYFVSDNLSGIDSISYIDKAEPISYEELIENTPDIFRDFKLNFLVEDKIIDTIDFKYGDSISQGDFPKIPEKEMHYSRWEEFDSENIIFDTDIHSLYFPYLTIIESKEKRDDTLAVVLVEGLFTEEDSLRLKKEKTEKPSKEKELDTIEEWNLIIPKNKETVNTIRFLPPEDTKNLKVYSKADDKWIKRQAKWDGKYLVFQAEDNDLTFKIVESKGLSSRYIILILIIIAAFIISALFIYRRKKNLKNS